MQAKQLDAGRELSHRLAPGPQNPRAMKDEGGFSLVWLRRTRLHEKNEGYLLLLLR